MYRIMVAKMKKENYGTLYQYLTTIIDNVAHPIEFETLEEVDTKVEQMLNDGTYSKSDFIVVQPVEYEITASLYENSEVYE